MRQIESLAKNLFRMMGIEIKYEDDETYSPNLYRRYLTGAISVKSPLNILQVGANDGKYNDPIYEFVKENRLATNIILVEPQQALIPYLEQNYSYHPSTEIFNKAILDNEKPHIQLFRVKKEFWEDIDVSYGDNWPDYRIPTGVTTSEKDRLIQWVSKNVQSELKPIKLIEEVCVDTITPAELLDKSNTISDIDVLQVDTEGLDDEIVYSFFNNNIYPSIINIECKHLNEDQRMEYNQRLSSLGYNVCNYTPGEEVGIKGGMVDTALLD